MGKLETVRFTVVNYGLAIVFRSTVTCVLKSSIVSDSATPWTVAHQSPLSMGFTRQEYWNGLPFPSPGDLPDSGIEPRSTCTGRQTLYHVSQCLAKESLYI